MTVLDDFKLFEKTVLELGFEKVKEQTYRWNINPILFVDVEYRVQYLLYTINMKIGKPKDPLGTLEYKNRIYKADDLLWCDKDYIKRIIQSMLAIQSMFANMIKEHIDLSWDTVIMK